MVARLRIAFLGTAEFAVPSLEAILQAGHSVSGVVTQPDKPAGRGLEVRPPPVKAVAVARGIPVFQPRSLKTDDVPALFKGFGADVMVVVAYGKILPPWLVHLPPLGIVNVHGSLLPRWRGAAPVHWAIVNGDCETGVSTMRVAEGLDTGPVYLSERTPIGPDETAPDLASRLAIMGGGLLVTTIDRIAASAIEPTPQSEADATYAPILRKEDGFLDLEQSADRLHNRVRGLQPWPGCQVRFRGGLCRIVRTRLESPEGVPHRVGGLVVTPAGLFLGAGQGSWLQILEVQPENRRVMAGRDFANGMHLGPDDRMEPVSRAPR